MILYAWSRLYGMHKYVFYKDGPLYGACYRWYIHSLAKRVCLNCRLKSPLYVAIDYDLSIHGMLHIVFILVCFHYGLVYIAFI